MADLDTVEKLFRRVSGAGQTDAEQAAVFQLLIAQLRRVRPTFTVPPQTAVWRIDRESGAVTSTVVGPQGLHLRFEHLTSLPALFGGHAVFRPQSGTLLVVAADRVALCPGDPF